ncbi:hypothetical protein PIIN_11161 [Serendipita indica DSM 11827]|uniref:Uncharacterized protein n=1 Tax=Serendipita indica (strain DSM 11827) TaxID=1109443 RepID=G4U0T6_SERID|nr:hypothetical protein PIIN_11161 [Serendipita indica DSM 11827]
MLVSYQRASGVSVSWHDVTTCTPFKSGNDLFKYYIRRLNFNNATVVQSTIRRYAKEHPDDPDWAINGMISLGQGCGFAPFGL